MAGIEEILEYLNEQTKQYRQLSHANNLLGKWNSDRITEKQKAILIEILPKYYDYLSFNISNKGYSEHIINQRVATLNTYYNFFFENNYDNAFSSQGKFRPTILEEFMFLLFKDYVSYLKTLHNDDEDVLDSGSSKAYTNLYFTSNSIQDFIAAPSIEINVKDQDFAIYRKFQLAINENKKDIRIPIVAVECKTYIDKTMLDGIMSTAEKIKTGNPYSLFVAITENYDVDLKVDPAYSRIDQIYVLRKCKRKEEWANIDPKVVWRAFYEVRQHIERPWSNVEHKMRNEGVII